MIHDEKAQQWFEDRKAALQSFRVEADKRTQEKEWLAGEDPAKFVSESLENWLKDNPFPAKEEAA